MDKKDIRPEVKAFSISVELPVSQTLVLASLTIPKWERLFAHYRDVAKNDTERIQFDACRATMKWAEACGATCVKLKRNSDYVEFTFKFWGIRSLYEFQKDLEVNVVGAIRGN